MKHVSIKIRSATLPKLRLLSALTGTRITTLIDTWATTELAQRGHIDTPIDTQGGDHVSPNRHDVARQDEQ